MLFNSIDFAVFLPIVFILYWFVISKNLRWQNLLIVVASYTFYGWWDWRFLSLIVFSTTVDFAIGKRLSYEENIDKRKVLLWASIVINLGFLGFFKYYNFFVDNFISAFSFFGKNININTLNIILPVGISFYTFQTLSYSIDVYRKKLDPTKDFVAFAAFVSFFPQLVAGPIERAVNLLPQFYKKRTFDYVKAVDGMRQILWGLFKKVVIADNCAEFVNIIFGNSDSYPSIILILGAVLFSFQIYGDFSGYSDIAIGTSKLFGFNLMRNFAFPYFSRDMAEFWRRWHISLSTWFRDYLYIPLGGSRGSLWTKIRNTFAIFVVSGFWHGASWTFIIWGTLNALYFIPLLLFNQNRNHIEIVAKNRLFPDIKSFLLVLLTFGLTTFSWIFFRADSLPHALEYISGILSPSLFNTPSFEDLRVRRLLVTIVLVMVFLVIEWIGRAEQHPLAIADKKHIRPVRYVLYYCITVLIIALAGEDTEFIYFQF